MTNWPDLVKVALLGTTRGDFEIANRDDAIGEILAQLPRDVPAQTLLATAATLTVHQEVGQEPRQEKLTLLEPSDADDLPRCSKKLHRFFGGTINGRYNLALPELLAAIAAKGERIPPEVVPNLLQAAIRNKAIYPLVQQTIGKRGRWLAAQNRTWSFAIGEDNLEVSNPDAIWRTGNSIERRLMLKNLRTLDPQRARELLLSTWEQEGARDRIEFLRAFEHNLLLDDEPFLETLLDDRSYPVRRQAVGYLSGLPQSRLCQRMTARIEPRMYLKKGKNGRFLDIDPITVIDEALTRDGIIGRAANRGLNAESWRTAQVLGAVPLSVWEEKFKLTPVELVKAAVAGFKTSTLIRGWSLAARRQKSIVWSEALLFGAQIAVGTNQMLELVPYLTIEKQEMLALRLLKEQPSLKTLQKEHPITITLKKMKHIWSVEMSSAIMYRLAEDISDDKKGSLMDWRFREAVKRFAYHFPTSLFDDAKALLEPAANGRIWQIRIKEFLDILEFRRDMLEAVNSNQ